MAQTRTKAMEDIITIVMDTRTVGEAGVAMTKAIQMEVVIIITKMNIAIIGPGIMAGIASNIIIKAIIIIIIMMMILVVQMAVIIEVMGVRMPAMTKMVIMGSNNMKCLS